MAELGAKISGLPWQSCTLSPSPALLYTNDHPHPVYRIKAHSFQISATLQWAVLGIPWQHKGCPACRFPDSTSPRISSPHRFPQAGPWGRAGGGWISLPFLTTAEHEPGQQIHKLAFNFMINSPLSCLHGTPGPCRPTQRQVNDRYIWNIKESPSPSWVAAAA